MHILFLTNTVPYPLDAGAKLRQYHMLEYLARRHQVTLVCFGRASDRAEAVDHLQALCRQVRVVPMRRSRPAEAVSLAESLFTGRPFTIQRDERRAMFRALGEAIAAQPFDAVHADQLSMARYALWARDRLQASAAGRALLVLDAHNAYYLIPQRMASVARNPALKAFLGREARLMARYERDTYQRVDHLLTVTDEDLAAIRRIMPAGAPQPAYTMLPICVDTGVPPVQRRPDARGLLMLGGLHWPPNADAARWFAGDIWPRVAAAAPDARLNIVGARPPADLRELAARADRGTVTVTGYVDDPAPILRDSAALIVALRSGGGMRVKIVEALRWGLPIVTTAIGCEGIRVTHGVDALIADQPEPLAQAALSVLRDADLARRLSENGRRLVERLYDWRATYQALDAIYPPQ
jgi:glycosyltransferase involved in cell wall biosynthesis